MCFELKQNKNHSILPMTNFQFFPCLTLVEYEKR